MATPCRIRRLLVLLAAVAVAVAFAVATLAATASAAVTYDRKALVVNGRRRILLSGSIH